MFTFKNLDPETYRQRTRKSSLIVIVIFAALGMGFSSILGLIWGIPGGSNFRLNLLGVGLGVISTLLLVRYYLGQQPFMAEALYGWHLKRSLMRVTNIMHRVRPLAESGHPRALQVLRFYHLALEQMHRLDGNDTGVLELRVEKLATEQQMQELGLDTDLQNFNPQWLKELSDKKAQ